MPLFYFVVVDVVDVVVVDVVDDVLFTEQHLHEKKNNKHLISFSQSFSFL